MSESLPWKTPHFSHIEASKIQELSFSSTSLAVNGVSKRTVSQIPNITSKRPTNYTPEAPSGTNATNAKIVAAPKTSSKNAIRPNTAMRKQDKQSLLSNTMLNSETCPALIPFASLQISRQLHKAAHPQNRSTVPK
jgi:hypothetical protein